MTVEIERPNSSHVQNLIGRQQTVVEMNAWRNEAMRLSLKIDHIFDAASAGKPIQIGDVTYVPADAMLRAREQGEGS